MWRLQVLLLSFEVLWHHRHFGKVVPSQRVLVADFLHQKMTVGLCNDFSNEITFRQACRTGIGYRTWWSRISRLRFKMYLPCASYPTDYEPLPHLWRGVLCSMVTILWPDETEPVVARTGCTVPTELTDCPTNCARCSECRNPDRVVARKLD